MAFLTLNGLAFSILDKKAEFDTEELGEQVRAVSGQLIGTRRNVYRVWKLTTICQTQTDTDLLRNLVLGLGHHWNFDFDTYSSKGLGPVTLTGNTVVHVHSTKFGANYAQVTTSLTYAGAAYNPLAQNATNWTVLYWKWNGSSWDGIAVRSDGTKYINGVQNNALSTTYLTVNGTGDVAFTTGDYDDLVVVPYLLRPSDMAFLTTATNPFSDLPRLFLSGDLVGQLPNSCIVLGTAGTLAYQQGNVAGAGFADNNETLAFVLTET